MTNQKEETSRLLSRASKDFTNHIFRSQFLVVGVERRSNDDFVDAVAVDVDVVDEALDLVIVQLLAQVHHDGSQLPAVDEPVAVLTIKPTN